MAMDEHTKIDLDSVSDRVYPEITLDTKGVAFIGKDGKTTFCNLDTPNNPPYIAIISPHMNEETLSLPQLRIAALDADREALITKMEYTIDNGARIPVTFTPEKGVDVTTPLTGISGGVHTVKAFVKDEHGIEASATTTFTYLKGEDVEVSLTPTAVDAGQTYNIKITKGLPNSPFVVTYVSGPTQNAPASGSTNAAGEYNATAPTTGFAVGAYVWRFTFPNNVTRDVNFAIRAVQLPILTLSEGVITQGQNISVTITNATPGSTWTLGGTSGVSGSIRVNASGTGTLQVTPSQSGTIIATDGSTGTVLTKTVTVNAAANPVLTITPTAINTNGTVTATITGATPGTVYTIGGTSGNYTNVITVGADGKGSVVLVPGQTGTITATTSGQPALSADVTVTEQVYAPQLQVKRLNDTAFGTNLTQVPITETLVFKISGARPNTAVSLYESTTESGQVQTGQQYFLNIGNILYWAYDHTNNNAQAPGSQILYTDAQGNATVRFVAQRVWPLDDGDNSNMPPVNLNFRIQFQDGTQTNSVSVRWARTYLLRATNIHTAFKTPSNTWEQAWAESVSSQGDAKYTNDISCEYDQELVFLMQNADPEKDVSFSESYDGGPFEDRGLIKIYKYSGTDKTVPIEQAKTDGAGAYRHYARVNFAGPCGIIRRFKFRTDGHETSVVTLRQGVWLQHWIDQNWVTQNAASILYDAEDINDHFIADGTVNVPSNWKPIRIGIKKVSNGVTTIGIVVYGGNIGDRVTYKWQEANIAIDGGVNIQKDAQQMRSAYLTVQFKHNDYAAGTTANLVVSAGSMQSKLVVKIDMLPGEVVTVPPPVQPATACFMGNGLLVRDGGPGEIAGARKLYVSGRQYDTPYGYSGICETFIDIPSNGTYILTLSADDAAILKLNCKGILKVVGNSTTTFNLAMPGGRYSLQLQYWNVVHQSPAEVELKIVRVENGGGTGWTWVTDARTQSWNGAETNGLAGMPTSSGPIRVGESPNGGVSQYGGYVP